MQQASHEPRLRRRMSAEQRAKLSAAQRAYVASDPRSAHTVRSWRRGADRETHDAVPDRVTAIMTRRKKAGPSPISEEIGIAPRSPEGPCHGATVLRLASILEPSSQASCEVRKYEFDLRTQASISSSRISQPYGLSWSEQDVTLRRNRDGPGRRVPSWPNVCCFIPAC